jgi:hypothetical protein
MNLGTWAARHGVSALALQELRAGWGMDGIYYNSPTGITGASEAAVSIQVRLEAARRGLHLWRNNVGSLKDDTGRFVRYGLANDSKALNEKIKSGDLIGIRPIQITGRHVGMKIGQFVSLEVKDQNWQYKDTPRERAQLRWIELVTQAGGDAKFITDESTI